MSTIFISHSSSDSQMALELERELAKQNHSSVFLDVDPSKGIIGGQSWERTLYRKLRSCRAIIAICTDDYLASRWCFAEIALARMEGKPIFALKGEGLSADARLPSILSENQYIKMVPNPEEGYQRLWRGLKEIDLLGVAGDWNPNEPPYLGLSAFHEKHAPVFFGREDESRAGVELLERGSPNLIMVLGGSGSGKSSLVRAGILPRLRQDTDRWLVVEPFRPGTNPFIQLADSLIRTYRRYAPDAPSRLGKLDELSQRLQLSSGDDESDLDRQSQINALSDDERVQRLLKQLEELQNEPPESAHGQFLKFLDWSVEDLNRICEGVTGPAGLALNVGSSILVDIADDLRRAANRPYANLLIVVDQFEELLNRRSGRDMRNDFLHLLRVSIEAENSPLVVLGTMRSDFLSQFQHNKAWRGIDFESLSLGPMRVEGIRRVIEEPARLAALTLEDGLADRLIEDTGSAVALPLLSFTLWKLWRDCRDDGLITIDEYEQLGGLDGAIASEANGLLKKEEAAALRRAFLQMVRLSDDGVYARRPVAWEAKELQPVHGTLQKFIDRRLIFTLEHEGELMVEVAHESLFNVWPPLRGWLENDRAELLLKQEIQREAKSWEDSEKRVDHLWRGARLYQAKTLFKQGSLGGLEEQFVRTGLRRQRWRRVFWIGCLLLTIITLSVLLVFKWIAEDEAEQARVEAQQDYEMTVNYVTSYMDRLMPDELDGAQPGNITVNELAGFDVSTTTIFNGRAVNGNVGKGRVFALAHDGVLARTHSDKVNVLGPIINWISLHYENDPEILFTTGHCEVVSNGIYEGSQLPLEFLTEYYSEPRPIADLTQLSQASVESVLIVGSAWASFSAAEVEALNQFVRRGGGLLMAGLQWSWAQYAGTGQFNPCSFAPHSSDRSSATDVYPMNQLGKPLGIEWTGRP